MSLLRLPSNLLLFGAQSEDALLQIRSMADWEIPKQNGKPSKWLDSFEGKNLQETSQNTGFNSWGLRFQSSLKPIQRLQRCYFWPLPFLLGRGYLSTAPGLSKYCSPPNFQDHPGNTHSALLCLCPVCAHVMYKYIYICISIQTYCYNPSVSKLSKPFIDGWATGFASELISCDRMFLAVSMGRLSGSICYLPEWYISTLWLPLLITVIIIISITIAIYIHTRIHMYIYIYGVYIGTYIYICIYIYMVYII